MLYSSCQAVLGPAIVDPTPLVPPLEDGAPWCMIAFQLRPVRWTYPRQVLNPDRFAEF
jgi:hypothetical protein